MVVSESFNRVRYQDLAVLIAFISAVFIFRAPDVFQLKPVWRFDVAVNHNYSNILPLPLISDLDNDGINELIVATGHGTIKVMTFPSHDPSGHSVLPHLHTKHETSLRNDGNSSNHQAIPVAMAAGCLHVTVKAKSCSESIVVVTSDWSVYLYDHYLKLLWKTTVNHHKDQLLHFREIAALIIPHGEDGLVIIGGRAGTKSHGRHTFNHNHHTKDNVSMDAVDELTRQGFARPTLDSRKVLNDEDHFSSYALSGVSGRLLWSHKPGDFEVNRTAREVLLSSYHFKLALHPNQHHTGEEHWTKYHGSFLRVLPYRWHHRSDTTLSTRHFVKGATKALDKKNKESWFDIKTPDIDIFSSDDKNAKQSSNQNAIVIHNKYGIEILQLQTGRPMCHFAVNKEGVTIGDVNNDGVIDHVSSRFMSSDDSVDNSLSCAAIVTSESRVLFEGPICQTVSLFGGIFDNEVDHREEVLPVPPVVVDSPPHRAGILRHLMGHNLRRGRVGLDSIFLVSTGKVTSFGPHGELNWQVKIDGGWNHRAELRQDNAKYFPSMKPVSIEIGLEQNALLITSWLHMSLVALVDGTVLASHTLPCQPMSPVIYGDFTNDGLTDFVVPCSDSYLGFSLDRSISYTWTIIWLVSGFLVLGMALGLLRLFEEVIL